MRRYWISWLVIFLCIYGFILVAGALAKTEAPRSVSTFPRSLGSYHDAGRHDILAILQNRIQQEPFNLLATLIFFCAIVHTFLTSKFLALAHKWEHAHAEKIARGLADEHSVHHGAEVFHFLGEVEVVFGIWALALTGAIVFFYDWKTLVTYISYRVNFTEALFVVVIMTLASTRPILKLAEQIMWKIASLVGGSLKAWWFTILTVGPALGALITEPAAMTISALMLAHKLYELQPSQKFKYATLGLLFVNISVGGTLTHFAAPPVLMVAGPWNWGLGHMIANFGWKAFIGIVASNAIYFFVFRRELARLQQAHALRGLKDEIQKKYLDRRLLVAEFKKIAADVNDELGFRNAVEQQLEKVIASIKRRLRKQLEEKHLPGALEAGYDPALMDEAFEKRFEEIKVTRMREVLPGLLPENQRPRFRDPEWDQRDDPVPAWVVIVHVLFMAWTIANAHHPELFIPGLLFFLGFAQVSAPYQNRVDLKPPLLVGFFLGGLVIHGGVQGWWIEPVLGNLKQIPLMLTATVLTAFNDNAAITFLSTLVPGFAAGLKYAVVAGAVAGGGLTVIANAPNPAGQAILKKYFENGVAPIGLLKAALVPTLIVWLAFLVF